MAALLALSGAQAAQHGAQHKTAPPRRELVHSVLPYPEQSRRLGEEGTAKVSYVVLADGTVSEVKLVHSSGFARLDDNAVASVRRWRYTAAVRGTRPVRHLVDVEFKLKKSDPLAGLSAIFGTTFAPSPLDKLSWPVRIVLALGGVTACLIYAVPIFIAVRGRSPRQNAILWLTLLLGWTVIGWLAALIWAASTAQRRRN